MMDRSKGHDQHAAIQESGKQRICWYHNTEINSNGSEMWFFPQKEGERDHVCSQLV